MTRPALCYAFEQTAQARKEAAQRAHAESLERARREYHQDRVLAEQRKRDNAAAAAALAGGAGNETAADV